LENQKLEDDSLRETLIAAKTAFDAHDPTGDSFRKLSEEIKERHQELKEVLDRVMSGEEPSKHTDDDDDDEDDDDDGMHNITFEDLIRAHVLRALLS